MQTANTNYILGIANNTIVIAILYKHVSKLITIKPNNSANKMKSKKNLNIKLNILQT